MKVTCFSWFQTHCIKTFSQKIGVLFWELNYSDILLLFIIRSFNMPENKKNTGSTCPQPPSSCQGWYVVIFKDFSSYSSLLVNVLNQYWRILGGRPLEKHGNLHYILFLSLNGDNEDGDDDCHTVFINASFFGDNYIGALPKSILG